MRSDNSNFAELNVAQQREPSFVVEISFDTANTDLLYLTFDTVSGLSGSNVVDGVLEKISGTTQKLDPRKALSTIGSLSFSAVDDTLTATQKTKLEGGDGLRGKRVRFYVGAADLDWSVFMLAQTQVIESVSYKDNSYSFKCSDIQREMRKDIFDPKKTALSDDLGPTDTTVNVYNTNEFELVQHPASVDGKPHLPGVEAGYIKLEQNGEIEIIAYQSKTATTFDSCTRGVFNTKPLEILLPRDELDNIDVEEDSAPKVEEFVYLELPAPMLAYALLTGSIYGETGKTLPDHWHLGISTDYVKTSDFTNIGVDWWDTSNADKGVVSVVKGVKKTDGKKFIEEQIYRMLGAFSPVYSTGELGLKRMTVVHSTGGHVATLDETNVVSYGSLTHDMNAVINQLSIAWNWEPTRDAYTRANLFIDTESISTHGEAKPLELELRTLASSRHSKETLKKQFDSLRDRYAGPPLRLDLTLTPDQNVLEVGDVVKVDLDAVLDYTGAETDHTINRNFEVQQVSTDWVNGQVKVRLFGSSQRAGALTAVSAGSEVGSTLAAGFWTVGTEISNANFGGNVTSSEGQTTISGPIELDGDWDLTNSGAIFYCNEDLTIQDSVTVTIKKNVQIRVNGHFEINGVIDGKGQGAAGGSGVSCYREDFASGTVPNYAAESVTWKPDQKYIGTSAAQPGFSKWSLGSTNLYGVVAGGQLVATTDFTTPETRVTTGINPAAAPTLSLFVSDDLATIEGIPVDISGQPGAGGGSINDKAFNASPGSDDASSGYGTHLVDGGDGGNGGAGLMLFTQGIDITEGAYIDTSGGDGSDGSPYVDGTRTLYSGKGAGGAPGAIYMVFTDALANRPDINSSTLKCFYGSSDASSYSTVFNMTEASQSITDFPTGNISIGFKNSEPQPDHTINVFENFKRIQYVEGFVAPVEDIPRQADDVPSFTLTEYTNTPASQQGNISTIEVSVTAPSDPNYSYAFIQYKNSLNSPWLDAGPASPEGAWQVPSDGLTYYVRALSVSTSGVMSSTGPQDSITVADVVNDPDTEAPNVMDFVSITVSCESGGATFTGKDAKFNWTDTNKDKLHFLEYKVEIKDGSANLMRTERTKDAFYVYSYEKNKEDYEAYHASEGANRSIEITVTVVGALDITGGKYEGPTDSLSVSNPAPAAVGSLVVSPGYGVIYVNGTNPTDLDFTKFGIYLSETASFTAGPSNFLGYANQLPITIASDVAGADLASGTTYYLRLESYDEFGAGSITTDYSALMAGVPAATEIPVAETLTVNGRIIADASGDPYNVVMGPQTVDSRAALFNFKNTTTGTHYFALFEDGTVEVNGKITIGSGSTVPYSYVTSGPPSNADNTGTNTSADTTMVNGVAASTVSTGAQRANTGLNSSGQVTQIVKGVNLPSIGMSTGLNLTSTYMGYYNGSSWGSYIQSNGNFHFGGSGSNYIEWNGSTLTVEGDIRTSASGQRIELDSSVNELIFYDSGNAERVTIDDATSSTGYIDINSASSKYGIRVTGTPSRGVVTTGTIYGLHSTTSASSSIAVYGSAGSGSAGEGVRGVVSGGGGSFAVRGIHSGTDTNGAAVYADANGTSMAIQAIAISGKAGYFYNAGSNPSVDIRNNSTGDGINVSCSGGTAVEATATTGIAGDFRNSGSNMTLYVENASSGAAIHADSATGYGVLAYSGGSGDAAVYGIGSSSVVGVAGSSSTGRGVQGIATSSTLGTGVYGHGGDYGGYFDAPHSGGVGVYGYGASYGAYLGGGTYSAYLTGSIRLGSGAVYSFTGAHECLLLKTDTAPVEGDIMVAVSIVNKSSASDVIPRVVLCDSVESKATYGVMVLSSDLPDYETGADIPIETAGLNNLDETTYTSIQTDYTMLGVNGVGEGQINVCDDNGDIEVGDFISTSATPGKGQLYTGNDMRVVVAKALEPVDWSEESETTKMIACIYMCS